FASPTVASGGNDPVTILLKDLAGNPVTGVPGSQFSLALSGGTSSGRLGPVTESATTRGAYTATFTATTAGTASTLTVTVAGTTLTARPTVTVTPGPVSGTNSTVGLAVPTVSVGDSDAVTVVVKDAAGNAVTGLGGSAFSFALSAGTSAG